MPQTKSLQDTSSKWARRAGSASQEYSEGVSNPRRDWKSSTLAGEKNYEMGVQAAIGRKSFGSGVSKAGTEKWQSRSKELGGARFASGVQASESAYNAGFAPYHSVLSSLALPPRGAKGDPSNMARVAAVTGALRAKKLAK